MKAEENVHRPTKWSSTREHDTLTFTANVIHGVTASLMAAVSWLMCLSVLEKWRKKLGRTKLLTFQIVFGPANGSLTSGVSAGAGNWHAWLPRLPRPPPADWKLNMSFVSQGWASIQSRLGVHPNARSSFDFMRVEFARSWSNMLIRKHRPSLPLPSFHSSGGSINSQTRLIFFQARGVLVFL